jgi:hypothetical protein
LDAIQARGFTLGLKFYCVCVTMEQVPLCTQQSNR